MDSEINILKDNILYQAKYFLNEMGEFFPFGVELDYNNNLINVNFTDDEFPIAEELIKLYEAHFKNQIEENNVKVVGLAVDVKINSNNLKSYKDAIELRIYHIDGILRNYYLPYFRNKANKIIYQEEYFE
jgi:hypothetical protein